MRINYKEYGHQCNLKLVNTKNRDNASVDIST